MSHLDDIAILREHVDGMRPNPCCRGEILRESGGRETGVCEENCQWAKLDQLIANVSVTMSSQRDRIDEAVTGLAALSDRILALRGGC